MDWEKVKEWDMKYYLPVGKSMEEYVHIPVARAEGCYIYRPDGTKILDFLSEAISVNIGHCHPKVQEAIREATERYSYVRSGFCTDYRAKASKLIIEDLLGPDEWAGRLRFCSTGSEAVETALIIARLYTNRPNTITRDSAYHGWTQGAAGCTRVRTYRNTITSAKEVEIRDDPLMASMPGFYVAPAPFCYRCPIGHEYPGCKMADGKLACVYATENLINTLGPETVAAIITEPIFGAGTIQPPPEYNPQIRRMTKELGILWIDDEIICGFGRLGKWFGYQWYEDVKPDIMTMAKGISSSAIPAAGVVVSKEVAKFFEEHRWWTLSTFASHPIAMAAAVANIEAMMEMNIPELALKAGKYLESTLDELANKHICVGLVSGQGLLWGIEIVRNRQTREPFVKRDRQDLYSGYLKKNPNEIVGEKCFEKGVFLGGFSPNTVRIGPPLTISEDEMNQAVDALDYALTEIDKLCD